MTEQTVPTSTTPIPAPVSTPAPEVKEPVVDEKKA